MPLEQDKSNGFKFSSTDELRSGAWPENFAANIPFFETVSNVEFTEQGVKKIHGWEEHADVGTDNEPVRGLLQVLDGTSRMIYAGTLSKIYEIDEGTSAAVGSSYTGTENATTNTSEWDAGASTWDGGGSIWDSSIGNPTQWSMVNFGTWVLATNGKNTPQIFKGTSFGAISGLPTTKAVSTWEIFAKRGPYVLAFNSNVDSRDFYWCATDDPDNWEPTTTNAAGDLRIREMKTAIRAAVPLGDRIAVYGDDQMFLVNYLGSPNYFGYQPALDGIGAVSKHAVIPVGRRNYGWSQQGFFVTDGVSFDYIDDPMVRKFIDNNVSRAHIGKVNGYHDEQNNQVRWYYPDNASSDTLQGKVDRGIIYNYKSNTWSLLDIGRSASSERLIYDHAISVQANTGVTATDGTIYFENYGENDGTSALVAYARTKGMDLGSADAVKDLSSIRIGVAGDSQGLMYRTGWADTEGGTITWDAYKSMPAGYDFANIRTAGRWLYLEFYSSELNDYWELVSLGFTGRVEGTR